MDEHLEGPSECENGALLGVDIAHMLCGAGGTPVSEVCAFFFQENDLCRGHIISFPSESADELCHRITTDIEDCGADFDLIVQLFHHSDWPAKQMQTLIFRDFTLLYDACLMADRPARPSRFKLILHDAPSSQDLVQLKQDIEMCLEGFTDAFDGLSVYRFVVDLDEVAVKAA